MESLPLVSVLMTSYNREKYIKEAIESVLESSFSNFELLILDDCSTDNTVNIALQYQAKDSRVRVYVNENNLGDYPNRNKAASLAKGKYLKYLDADDYIYPHGLESMVSSMEKYPEAALGLVKSANSNEIFPVSVTPKEAYIQHFLEGGYFFINSPLSAIIRADKFREIGGFSGKRHVGDYELWLKLGAKYNIVKLLPGLAFWRKHDDQENAISRKSLKRPVLNYLVEKSALESPNNPLTKAEKKEAFINLKKKYSRLVLRTLFSKDYVVAIELLKIFNLSFIDLISSFKIPNKL